MFDLLNLNPERFGLDISDLSIRIVKVRKRQNKLFLAAFGETFLPPGIVKRGEVIEPEKLAKAIKKLIKKTKGINTRYVVASLPEEKSFLRVMQMPKMSEKEIKSAIRFEAENYIPFSIDKVYLDAQIIPSGLEDQGYAEVLLVAAPRKTVDSYITAFNLAGLIPVALETESQAIARALLGKKPAFSPLFLVDWGATSVNFSVYYGTALRFTSFIPVSSGRLTLAIAQNLKKSLSQAEELKKKYGLKGSGRQGKRVFGALSPLIAEVVDQIKKHIDYYQVHTFYKDTPYNGKNIKTIVLCGGGANLKGLVQLLSKETGLIIKQGNPLSNFPASVKETKGLSRQKLLSFTTAIGLALRGLVLEPKMQHIKFKIKVENR